MHQTVIRLGRMAALAAALALVLAPVGGALKLKDVIKVGGIGFLVKKFHKPIDKAINELLVTNKVPTGQATKVVPVITAGKGLYVGAVQVTGPAAAVAKVQAVAQVEARYNTKYRMLVLIPTDTLNPLDNPTRVNGVGVSAQIEFKI